MSGTKENPGRYDALDADLIVKTIDRLSTRIDARFSGSGLYQVSRRLHSIAARAKERSEWIARPLWVLRLATGVIVLAVVGFAVASVTILKPREPAMDLSSLVQVLEPAMNVIVLIGAAVVFLVTLETRIKRRRALVAIHEIRSLAHIIDMHQLTKDPERLRSNYISTSVSPKPMKPFELGRYLDYCSEMLSLIGKIAALYVQHFDDAVVIGAASEVEDLCTGLARKIWQKIMILQPPEK